MMYKFHYDYIKNKYCYNYQLSILLFTDTDNLMYKIKTEYVYEEFSKNKAIGEFVGLNPKMHLLLVHDKSDHKKAKAWIVNTNTFCWIINAWGIQWIELPVKIKK